MAKIEIGGKQVEVDDAFLALTPEQQGVAVDEIYASMESSGDVERKPRDMSSSLPGMLGDFQNTTQAFQSGAVQGMTLGFGDELEGGLLAIPEAIGGMFQGKGFDIGQGYNQALERARAAHESSAELNPIASITGNVAGNMMLGGALSKGGLSFMSGAKPTLGSMAGRGALEGLTYGALTGLGTGETTQERLSGAASGGAIGGALGGITGGIAGALANKAAGAAAPTANDLGEAANDAYSAARQSGAVFTDNTTQELVDGMTLAAQDARINDLTAPQATAMLTRIQQRAGQPMTVGETEDIRVFLNQLRAGTDPNEARVAGKMIGAFDDLMASLKPADFSGGDAVAAMGNIAEGRRLFSTQKKTELIESVIQKAQDMSSANYSASGYENALRQQFKNLLTSPSALQGFSDAEVAAIRQVASGGPIENVLRFVGKLAPTGVISTGIGGGAGYAMGGPLGAAGVLGAGALARSGATASTLNNANLARALIAGGGAMPQIPGVASAASQALISGAGAQSGGNINDAVRRALMGN